MAIRSSRKGFVIPFALIVASMLMLSSFFLSKNTTHTINVKQKSLSELQNQYAVKSAMQHAMLKCLLMPTQLYDAAAFSIGQNPYFDFTEYSVSEPPGGAFSRKLIQSQTGQTSYYIKLASNLNPGPRFIAKNPTLYQAENNLRWSQISRFSSSDLVQTGNVSPWPNDKNGNPIPNPSIYLWKYYSDLQFDSSHYANLNYPYHFSYAVKDMKLAALDEQRKYNEEAIEVTVIGDTRYRNQDSSLESNAVIRIKRNG